MRKHVLPLFLALLPMLCAMLTLPALQHLSRGAAAKFLMSNPADANTLIIGVGSNRSDVDFLSVCDQVMVDGACSLYSSAVLEPRRVHIGAAQGRF